MDGATGDLNFTADALAASLEELLSSSAPSTPGSVSDNEDVGAPFSLSCVRHGLSEDRGPHAEYMQDAAVVFSDLAAAINGSNTSKWPEVTALYAVFDGHGCGNTGSHASQFAAERILRCLTSSVHFPGDVAAALRDALLQIEQEYWEAYTSSPAAAAASGGTTALVVVVWGNALYAANAGDSRAVLSRRGKAIVLTRDHKPLDPQEQQRIECAGGFVCADDRLCGRLSVSRAIGDFHYKEKLKGDPTAGVPGPLTADPEIASHQLNPNDEFIILACDGFWDVYKSSQRAVELARDWLKEHNNPQQCAQQLVADALGKHTSDNVTVIVACFGEDPPKRKLSKFGRFSPSVSSQGLNMLAAALQQ